MKVSLSASHGGNEAVISLLKTCDVIYTTQWFRLNEIRGQFVDSVVLPLPDSRNDTIAYLRERHRDDEVIDFCDLYKIRSKQDELQN